METTIRQATKNDLPIILEIFNHAIKYTTAVYSYEPYTPIMMDEWFEEKRQNNYPVFVSVNGDQVTGFVTYGSFRMRPAYKYAVEHSIYVHPTNRRQGIAKILMKHIIKVAIQDQKHTLIGGIDAENEISIQFHKEFGFEEVAFLKQVGYKFNKWLDLKFLQLILETPNNPTED